MLIEPRRHLGRLSLHHGQNPNCLMLYKIVHELLFLVQIPRGPELILLPLAVGDGHKKLSLYIPRNRGSKSLEVNEGLSTFSCDSRHGPGGCCGPARNCVAAHTAEFVNDVVNRP